MSFLITLFYIGWGILFAGILFTLFLVGYIMWVMCMDIEGVDYEIPKWIKEILGVDDYRESDEESDED